MGDIPVGWPMIGRTPLDIGVIILGGGGGGAGGRCMNDALDMMPMGIPVDCICIGIPPVICGCWYAL